MCTTNEKRLKEQIKKPSFIKTYFNEHHEEPIIENGALYNAYHLEHSHAPQPERKHKIKHISYHGSAPKTETIILPNTADLAKESISEHEQEQEKKAKKKLVKATAILFAVVTLLVGTMVIFSISTFSKQVISPNPTPVKQAPIQPKEKPNHNETNQKDRDLNKPKQLLKDDNIKPNTTLPNKSTDQPNQQNMNEDNNQQKPAENSPNNLPNPADKSPKPNGTPDTNQQHDQNTNSQKNTN